MTTELDRSLMALRLELPASVADHHEAIVRAMLDATDPLLDRLVAEIERQDEKHGGFSAATELGRSRLGIAVLEDELAEALLAWREERFTPTWDHTREEVLQVAAVAIRLLRDVL